MRGEGPLLGSPGLIIIFNYNFVVTHAQLNPKV